MNQAIKHSVGFFLGLCIFLVPEVKAQDEISDLSLDELAHVSIEKKTIGLLENKKFDPDRIYLGLVVPYSTQKEYSEELRNAGDMAVEEINQSGGVIGKNLALVAADDGAFKELAVLYADSLVRRYKISALIGPTGSSRVLHLGRTYLPQHPILVVSPSASSEEIEHLEDDDLIWRTMPSDAKQIELAADYIFNKLKRKSAGIIYSQDAYGKGLYKQFKKYFKGEVLSEVSFSQLVNLKTFDFAEKMDELFRNKPEVIFMAMGGSAATAISHQISKSKYITPAYKPAIFGVDAMRVTDFIKTGDKDILEGMYGSALRNNNSGEFRTRFFNRYKRYPTSSDSEKTYDIVYILALAMEKANSANYKDIRNELRNVTGNGEKIGPLNFAMGKERLKAKRDIYFEGASGKIKFDEKGDLTSGIFEIWKIVNGQYVTHEVLPSGSQN